jgi:hypothetical protein
MTSSRRSQGVLDRAEADPLLFQADGGSELGGHQVLVKGLFGGVEQGKGTASTENLLRVLRILGILDTVVTAADPYQTDIGRLRADEILPKRVRG